MQSKEKACKGFTLAELAIALSVGAIVLAMLAVSVFYLHKAFTNSEYTSNSLAEYNALKENVCNINNDWLNDGFAVAWQSESEVACFVLDSKEHSLLYKDNALLLDEKEIIKFHYIKQIVFEKQENNILVKVVLSGEEKMQFII